MCQHINVNYQISSRNSVRLFFQVAWSPSCKSISSEAGNYGLLKIRTVCASCPVFRPYVLHFRRTVGKDHRVRISKARRIIWQLAGDHNNRLPRVVPCFYDPVEDSGRKTCILFRIQTGLLYTREIRITFSARDAASRHSCSFSSCLSSA